MLMWIAKRITAKILYSIYSISAKRITINLKNLYQQIKASATDEELSTLKSALKSQATKRWCDSDRYIGAVNIGKDCTYRYIIVIYLRVYMSYKQVQTKISVGSRDRETGRTGVFFNKSDHRQGLIAIDVLLRYSKHNLCLLNNFNIVVLFLENLYNILTYILL